MTKAKAVLRGGVMHQDSTGRFPITSLSGNEYIMVFYCEDSNYIHVEPYAFKAASSHTAAFDRGFKFFTTRGRTPRIQRLDNECSAQLLHHMQQVCGQRVELVAPEDHGPNKVKRAIQTWKDHFIAGLATVDPDFPIGLWDQCRQLEDVLNMMRGSHTHPHLTAYEELNGPIDSGSIRLLPFGLKVCALNDPKSRGPYQQRCTTGFVINFPHNHHRS